MKKIIVERYQEFLSSDRSIFYVEFDLDDYDTFGENEVLNYFKEELDKLYKLGVEYDVDKRSVSITLKNGRKIVFIDM